MSSRPRRGVCHTNNRDFLDETTCIAIGLIGLIVLVIVYMVKGKFNKKSLDASGPRKSKEKKKAVDIHMLSNCSKRRHNLYINQDESQRTFDEMQVKCLTYGNAQSSSKNNADMPFRNGHKKKQAYYTRVHADIVQSGHGKSLHFNKISETQCANENSITKDSNNHRISNDQNNVNDIELQQCSSEKRSSSKILNLKSNDSHLQSMNSNLTESIVSYGFSKLQSKSSQCENKITENLKSPKVSDKSVIKRQQSKEEGDLLKNAKSKENQENKKVKKRLESNIFQDMKSKCCKSKIKNIKSKDKRAKTKPSHITNFIVLPSRSELQSTVSINIQSPNSIHNDHQGGNVISSTIHLQTPSSTSGSHSAIYSDLSKNSTSVQPQSQILNRTETSRCSSGNNAVNLKMSTAKSDGLKQFLDCATIQQQNVNLDDGSNKDLKLSQHSISKYISDCSNIVNVVEYKKFQLQCSKQRSVLSKNHNIHDEDQINSQITIRSFIPQQDNKIYHQSRNSNRNFALLEILNNEVIEQSKNSISSIPRHLTQNTQKKEEQLLSLQILEPGNHSRTANSDTTSDIQASYESVNESNTKKEDKNKIAPTQSVPQKAGWSIRKIFKYRPKKQ